MVHAQTNTHWFAYKVKYYIADYNNPTHAFYIDLQCS